MFQNTQYTFCTSRLRSKGQTNRSGNRWTHCVVEFPVTYVAIYCGCLVFAFIITESIEHGLKRYWHLWINFKKIHYRIANISRFVNLNPILILLHGDGNLSFSKCLLESTFNKMFFKVQFWNIDWCIYELGKLLSILIIDVCREIEFNLQIF